MLRILILAQLLALSTLTAAFVHQTGRLDETEHLSSGSSELVPIELTIKVQLPDKFKLNPLGPSQVTLAAANSEPQHFKLESTVTTISMLSPPKTQLPVKGSANIFFCEEQVGGRCFVETLQLQQTFDTQDPTSLEVHIAAPEAP